MLRQGLKNHLIGMNKEFRNRGEQATRIESFSDAIFALALTLIIISAQPPRSFQEMLAFMWDVLPFLFCITLITLIWYEHFTFFVRYGFRNTYIVFLNTVLLATVLIYVYPLRFLSRLLLAIFTNHTALRDQMISSRDVPDLMILYGSGIALIFFLFVLMYYYAWRCADELELNEVERFDTRSSIIANGLMGSVPVLSVLLAVVFRHHLWCGPVSGFTYFLYTPVMFYYFNKSKKQRASILAASSQPV